MSLVCSIVALCFQLIILVQCTKRFHLGRSRGGNLGAPAVSERTELPPALWFEQKLDHSSPTDMRTWKQVCYRFLPGYAFILLIQSCDGVMTITRSQKL